MLPVRCWARSCSGGSPTVSDARNCSSSRSRSISWPPPQRRSRGISGASSSVRFITGAGIGGEYTAINSTIQELIPARYRGWTDLVINGSFWIGAAIGAVGSIVLLDPAVLGGDLGWRAAFLIGAVLGVVVFLMRMWIPESPRWLMTHGRIAEAEAIVAAIENDFDRRKHVSPGRRLPRIRLRARSHTPLSEVARTLFRDHRQRTLVGLVLMASQAFFYNAIFFTYALVLTDFYGIRSDQVGWYLLPFAAGNFLGPVLLGRFFDTVGRRPMIAATYAISGVLLAITGYLFAHRHPRPPCSRPSPGW